jgi:hypothetical protein
MIGLDLHVFTLIDSAFRLDGRHNGSWHGQDRKSAIGNRKFLPV